LNFHGFYDFESWFKIVIQSLKLFLKDQNSNILLRTFYGIFWVDFVGFLWWKTLSRKLDTDSQFYNFPRVSRVRLIFNFSSKEGFFIFFNRFYYYIEMYYWFTLFMACKKHHSEVSCLQKFAKISKFSNQRIVFEIMHKTQKFVLKEREKKICFYYINSISQQ